VSKKNKKKELKWYNNGEILTTVIMAVIALIVVSSQGLANGQLSFAFFSSVINHNSIFILVFVYFTFLKFPFGKQNFNYLNIFLVFLYFITTVTSLLTVVQSFSLATSLSFVLNLLFLIYLSHTLFRDTTIWKDFYMSYSPFNELTNEWFFYTILVVTVISLAVDLISTVEIDGVVLSFLDALYYGLFARYIFLYREFLDKKKLDADNAGNFDEVREKVQDVLDQTEIDDKIVDGIKTVHEKVDTFVKENEIDKKVENVKDGIVKASNDVKDKIDEKIKKSKTSTKTKKGEE
jgi:hypothetical protein